jgi:hypothetical protein
MPALEFVGLNEQEQALIEQFVPHAIEEAGGFANFRETATKTNSLYDRVSELTLPEIDDVQNGLDRYLSVWEKGQRLEEDLSTVDEIIDQITYSIYGLSEEEIQVVESNYASTGLIEH